MWFCREVLSPNVYNIMHKVRQGQYCLHTVLYIHVVFVVGIGRYKVGRGYLYGPYE